MKMKAINFHARATKGLAELAQVTGLTIAEIVRRATDQFLEQEFEKLGRKLPEAQNPH